jgi:hypothetical protein
MEENYGLVFPVKRFETATSYISRLTRYCGLSEPRVFCLDFGFRWQDFVRGDDFLFERVAQIGGASAIDLKRWAVRTVDKNRFVVGNQKATKSSLVRSRLRVCPHCLIEDRRNGAEHSPFRRIGWQFWSIRTCPTHGVDLVVLPPELHTIHNYDFVGQVLKNWDFINSHADCATCHKPTEFERYIHNRLDGAASNPFLDDLPLYIAARLCEVLGFVLEFGPKRKISEATEDDLRLAGQAGFEALRAGEQGLYNALGTLVSPISLRTVRHQSDFGAFFEWLRTSSMGDDFEALRDKVRDFIFRTYPFREGDTVLGKTCSIPTVFTISGAWQSLGIQRARMNRILLAEGLAHKGRADSSVRLYEGLKCDAIDDLRDRISVRVNAIDAQSILGVSLGALNQLRDKGLITAHVDAIDQIPKFDRGELEELLRSLNARVAKTWPDGSLLLTLVDATRRVRCPFVEIVELILEGKLKTVYRDNGKQGLAALHISQSELRAALPQFEMSGVTKGEASMRLRVNYPTINFLIADGTLVERRLRNPRSRQFLDAVCTESLEHFEKRFETLGQLAKRYRRAAGPFGSHLEANGICPIEVPAGISRIYERRGLEGRLLRVGLSPPTKREAI